MGVVTDWADPERRFRITIEGDGLSLQQVLADLMELDFAVTAIEFPLPPDDDEILIPIAGCVGVEDVESDGPVCVGAGVVSEGVTAPCERVPWPFFDLDYSHPGGLHPNGGTRLPGHYG